MFEPVDDWTLQLLAALKRYLCAFTAGSKERALSTAYIDAFAGADYWADDAGDSSRLAGFPDLADKSPKALLKCSTRTALTIEPAFDGYVFIERNVRRCRVLEALAHEFSHRNLQVRRTDANRELRRISHLNWSTRRAVLFVPYDLRPTEAARIGNTLATIADGVAHWRTADEEAGEAGAASAETARLG